MSARTSSRVELLLRLLDCEALRSMSHWGSWLLSDVTPSSCFARLVRCACSLGVSVAFLQRSLFHGVTTLSVLELLRVKGLVIERKVWFLFFLLVLRLRSWRYLERKNMTVVYTLFVTHVISTNGEERLRSFFWLFAVAFQSYLLFLDFGFLKRG